MTGSTLCLSSHTIPGAVILGQWVGHIWHCQLGLFCVVWGFSVWCGASWLVVSQWGRAIVAVEKLEDEDSVVKCNGNFCESA